MSATILQFPKPFTYPEHWTANDRHAFDWKREGYGLSVEEAAADIEASIHRRRKVPGETDDESLLRQAREAIAWCRGDRA